MAGDQQFVTMADRKFFANGNRQLNCAMLVAELKNWHLGSQAKDCYVAYSVHNLLRLHSQFSQMPLILAQQNKNTRNQLRLRIEQGQ